MKRVLVTRPLISAPSFSAKLTSRGHLVITAPMIQIEPVEQPSVPPTPVDAVLLTSANAASLAPCSLLKPILDKPCFCVGPHTANAAKQAGFTKVIEGPSDGQALANLLIHTVRKDQTLVYLCSTDPSPALPSLLRKEAFTLQICPIYRSVPEKTLPTAAANALTQKKIDCGLFFSPRTAEVFVKLVQEAGLEDTCASVVAIGLSHAVTKALAPLPWLEIQAAKTPREDSLIACLEAL